MSITATALSDADAGVASTPISLALSGGGFRATLFHLGVIRHLYEQEILHRITQIASVSGGSVLAAHLVLHWGDYTNYGEPEKFKERANELIRFVRKGIRNQIFMEWLVKLLVPGFVIPVCLIMLAAGGILPPYLVWVAAPVSMLLAAGIYGWGLFARVMALTAKYDKGLFHGTRLSDLGGEASPDRRRPALYLTTTSLTTGEICCFTTAGFHRRDGSPDNTFGYPDCLVARAVAASSAFPPAFDPVKLTADDLGNPIDSSNPPKQRFPAEMRLTDGGVYDNLGLQALTVFGQPRGAEANLILSDAEQPFGLDYFEVYKLLTVRVARTTDIMMNRISHFQAPAGLAATRVRLQDRIPRDEALVGENDQGHIQRTRTDLDSFSRTEIQMLVHQGYAVARRAFGLPMHSEIRLMRKGLPYVFPPLQANQPAPKRAWLPYELSELGWSIWNWKSCRADELPMSSRRRIVKPFINSALIWFCCILPTVGTFWYVRYGQFGLPTGLRPVLGDSKALWQEKGPSYQLLTEYLISEEQNDPFALLTQPLGEATPGWFGLFHSTPAPFTCKITWTKSPRVLTVVLARKPKPQRAGVFTWTQNPGNPLFQTLILTTGSAINVPVPEPDDRLIFYGTGIDLRGVKPEESVVLEVVKLEVPR